MTTQTCKVTLTGPDGAIGLTATCTDDTFTELKDDIGTLHLYEVAKGKRFVGYCGYYTAGGGVFRVRNTQTNQIKALELLPMLKNQKIEYFDVQFVIGDFDILEVHCSAVPT